MDFNNENKDQRQTIISNLIQMVRRRKRWTHAKTFIHWTLVMSKIRCVRHQIMTKINPNFSNLKCLKNLTHQFKSRNAITKIMRLRQEHTTIKIWIIQNKIWTKQHNQSGLSMKTIVKAKYSQQTMAKADKHTMKAKIWIAKRTQ